jgi:hypothetical protein
MKRAVFVLAIAIFFSIISVSKALDVVYVDISGPNNPGTGSVDDPFRKIQDAIDSGSNGDIIEIRPGIYTGSGNYDLDPNGKSITIRSMDPNDPNIVANTIINPAGVARAFYFNNGEDANCVISGLTLKNGYTAGSGGAIYCRSSSPTISNCIIIDNTAIWSGGAVYCSSDSNMTLTNCVIAANKTNANGGGISYASCSSPKVINCTICSNQANWLGDGIYCFDSNTIITNSILWANDSNQIYAESSNPVVSYSNIQGSWIGGTNNIDHDPCFVAFDPCDPYETWDLHLQSADGRWDANSQTWINDVNTSLCVDTGDPNSDWTGELWPNGKRINMGVFGGTAQASRNGNLADFDVSGDVNLEDLLELTSSWLDAQAGLVNLNSVGRVDLLDFAIFADNWLWKKE